MIISKAHDFGFVHIAKCAGSTIRHQLRDKDDLDGRFYRTMEHETLGHINANHLPLHVLDEHFPAELAALRDVTSYTVLRAPMDRFISGVSQYVRDGGQEPGDLSPSEIRSAAHGIIDYMESAPDLPDLRHTLFARQALYVMLDGERVVDHTFPMEPLSLLFDKLEQDHDLHLIRDKVWNPTVTYRVPAMAGPLKSAKDLAQKVLPIGAYARLRDLVVSVATTKGVPKLNETLEEDSRVQGFLAEFYAEDGELFAAAEAAHRPTGDG